MSGASGAGLLLLPFEQTTSYLKGTAEGPAVLVPLVERARFARWTEVLAGDYPARTYLGRVAEAARSLVEDGLKIAAVGGEHTVTFGVLAGLAGAGLRPAVIQLDAHADLRQEYEGTPWSHACVMRRVVERLELPTLAAGIRSLSVEEASFIKKSGLPVAFAHELRQGGFHLDRELRDLGEAVYLTVDIDFLDPSVVPGTGTPEPGGLGWYEGLALIDRLLEKKKLVGFDVVEFCPAAEEKITVAAAARLFDHLAQRLD
jgi:agmatinase